MASMHALGLYREEAYAENGGHQTTLQPPVAANCGMLG